MVLIFEAQPTFGSKTGENCGLWITNTAPTIEAQTFFVVENSLTNTTIGLVKATDIDVPAQIITFSITGGTGASIFQIAPTTGLLTISNPAQLNYEVNKSFTLTILAMDNGDEKLSNSATITVKLLDVNDAPIILPQTFEVTENPIYGSFIGRVVATDEDFPAQTLTFSITSGNDCKGFTMDAQTGKITVHLSRCFYYGSNPKFVLIVRVADSGNPSLFSEALISVNVIVVSDVKFYTPVNNFFTPNNDGINDVLLVENPAKYGECILQIYDLRGALIFESKVADNNWDGTIGNKPAEDGVYLYYLNCKHIDETIKGSITLMR